MPAVKLPFKEECDPPEEELLERLDGEGIMRYGELVKRDTIQVRRTLDDLEKAGDIKRFAVGEHIMVRLERDDI